MPILENLLKRFTILEKYLQNSYSDLDILNYSDLFSKNRNWELNLEPIIQTIH